MPTKVFVTGFGTFGKTVDNPSAVLAERCGLPCRVLEVSWKAVDEWLDSGEAAPYDVLLHLGFAARRNMTPELFARNAFGATADVRGVEQSGEIEATGPRMVGSTLWTPSLLAGLVTQKRIRLSQDAGRYLCNYISYVSLRRFPEKRVGFLHVPSFETLTYAEQAAMLGRMIEAILEV